jgi:hypothetical protein
MSLTVQGNSCNLYIFEALIKKNHKMKFRGLTGFLNTKNILFDYLNAYQLLGTILPKWNKNIAWEQNDVCVKKK